MYNPVMQKVGWRRCNLGDEGVSCFPGVQTHGNSLMGDRFQMAIAKTFKKESNILVSNASLQGIATLKEEIMNVRNEMMSQSSEKPMEFLSVNGGGDEIWESNFHKGQNKVCTFGEATGVWKLDCGDMKQKTTLDTSAIQSFQLPKIRDGVHSNLKLNENSAFPELNSLEGIRQSSKEIAEGLCTGGLSGKMNRQQPNLQFKQPPKPQLRNRRRSWTPELHARFLAALEYLGGPEATPRQIREAMNIEDLTNDQVKSHLQKYRLSSRRVPATNMDSSGHVEEAQDRMDIRLLL